MPGASPRLLASGCTDVPILDVTPLGSSRSGAAGAATAIVDYLTRPAQQPPAGEDAGGPVAYYGDRAERPGIWRGRGVNGDRRTGEATPEQLRRLLLGAHPDTGAVLVAATGSAGRAARTRTTPDTTTDTVLDVDQAAARLGVDRSYVKRLLLATERHALDPDRHRPPLQPLHGHRDDAGRWTVGADELDRFAAARREPTVVVAYDATFKWEKSISAAWVQADPATRRVIEDALDLGVSTGIAYLENHALEVRHGDRRLAADGMWAVQYRHTTNRNLEPQLHDHVVIANIAADPNGTTKTIAARSLFRHATTAGHLAGQAVRHHLTKHLGYEWGPLRNGTCDLAHIHPTPLGAISTRSRDVRELAETYGIDSQKARRIAALATRRRKDEPTNRAALEDSWSDTLSYWGFSPEHERALRHRAAVPAFTAADARNLPAFLEGSNGVTARAAVFDRNDVVRAVIAWDGQHGGAARLSADDVEHHTDRWLTSAAVVRLPDDRHGSPRYTTEHMLRLEHLVIDAYRSNATAPRHVDPATVRTEQLLWQHATGHTLGDDQRRFVERLVTEPHRFGLGVGPAGTGKTASLAVACRAWETAGLQPLGTTVTGAAADVLADACGIPTRTVASLVTEIRNGGRPFTAGTVLVVDEASTLSNRDHHTLVTEITRAGAAMRAIGDPAQHRAVDAGGLWSQLLGLLPERVTHLEHNRRQSTASMADVRRAAELLRAGHGRAAVELLAGTNRLHTAAGAAELVADIVNAWHTDHRRHLTEGTAASRMMAEHHATRRLLNHAAQQLLHADGTITGSGVRIGDETIHVGDEVITRTQHRDIRGPNGRSLRNGVVGTVVRIDADGERPSVLVRFPGLGIQRLGHDWLHQEIRPGLAGAIAPAYAVTTHVAQGQTMDTGRAVITESTAPEAAYVALTRGRNDTRLYVLDSPARTERRLAAEQAELPLLLDDADLLAAVAERLQQRTALGTATSLDPAALAVHRLSLRPFDELTGAQHAAPRRMALDRAALRALVDPPAPYLVDYGPRPSADHPHRPIWDRAVRTRAEHELVTGRWNPADPAVRSAHEAARTAGLDRMPLHELNERLDRAGLSPDFHALSAAYERRIAAAVAEPARYLVDLLGPRPTDDHPLRASWDDDASLIETVRHRNGLEPTDGVTTRSVEGVLGAEPDDLVERLQWLAASRTVQQALDPPSIDRDELRHRAPRLRL